MLLDPAGKRPLRGPPLAGDGCQALRLKPADSRLRMAGRQDRRTAQMLPPLAGRLDAPPLPLPQQVTLKLGEAGHQREHQLAGRRSRVDAEIEDEEIHATPPQV